MLRAAVYPLVAVAVLALAFLLLAGQKAALGALLSGGGLFGSSPSDPIGRRYVSTEVEGRPIPSSSIFLIRLASV